MFQPLKSIEWTQTFLILDTNWEWWLKHVQTAFAFAIEKGASCPICTTRMFAFLLAATSSIDFALEVHVAIESLCCSFLKVRHSNLFAAWCSNFAWHSVSHSSDSPCLQLSPCHWCLPWVRVEQTFLWVKVVHRPTLRSTRDVEIYRVALSRGFAFGLLWVPLLCTRDVHVQNVDPAKMFWMNTGNWVVGNFVDEWCWRPWNKSQIVPFDAYALSWVLVLLGPRWLEPPRCSSETILQPVELTLSTPLHPQVGKVSKQFNFQFLSDVKYVKYQ